MGKAQQLILFIRDVFASDKSLWDTLIFNYTRASSKECPTESFLAEILGKDFLTDKCGRGILRIWVSPVF